MGRLFEELKRRNVFRVAIAYAVVGWIIMQVVTSIETPLSLPTWTDSLVIVLLVIGLPLAVLFAWAFEMTPQGVKKTKAVDKAESVTGATGRKLDFVIIAALALALGYFVWDKFAGGPRYGDETLYVQASIAVLPFVNMSGDVEQEYFSDGISEELLNLLAKGGQIKVAGRTSSFYFKGKNPDFQEIGETLGVEHILEGSVRKDGDQVRITAQLIKANDGFHLWSETYDRKITSVFAIQDEIAAAIVAALTPHLIGTAEAAIPEAARADIGAYDLYLLARSRIDTRKRALLEEARGYLEQAMAADPDYAPAHAAYAETISLLSDELYGGIPSDEVYGLAKPHIMQALALDPQFARAHAVLGLMELNAGNLAAAETSLDRAVRFEPTLAPAYIWRSNLYEDTGQLAQGFEDDARAFDLEPLWPLAGVNYAGQLLGRGRNDGALAVIRGLLRHHPDAQLVLHMEGQIHWAAGRLAEGIEYYERALALDPDNTLGKTRLADVYIRILAPERAAPYLTPAIEAFYFYVSEGPAAAAAAATEKFGPYPTAPQEIRQLAIWEGLAGNDARTIELLETFLAGGDAGLLTGGDGLAAALLVPALRRAGRPDDADALLAKFKEDHQELLGLGFRNGNTRDAEAYIATLEGDAEGFFAALEAAWQAGRRNVFLEVASLLDNFKGDPRWAVLRDRHYAAINAEREKLGLAPIPDDGWPGME